MSLAAMMVSRFGKRSEGSFPSSLATLMKLLRKTAKLKRHSADLGVVREEFAEYFGVVGRQGKGSGGSFHN